MGLAAGAAGADVGVEAATMKQGPAVAASWPSPAVGLKIESVLRLSAFSLRAGPACRVQKLL